ncbi:hypothetical protein, partial [Staphylococcus sp. HMSC059F04]|uniref:hypothetical protein n=1 Tax=Staphylococcus sp. HMSC059F04 TaxID=1739368 RepID=UPI001C401C63
PSKASWGGAPTQRLSKRKATDNASWGEAQVQKNWLNQFFLAMISWHHFVCRLPYNRQKHC